MKRAIGGAFLLLFLLFPSCVFADIRINEFLVDPSPQQVEIFNTGDSTVDISGWYIDDSDGSTYFKISDGTQLQPKACQVFSADFNFNKTSADSVRLFDPSKNPTEAGATIIDSYSYSSSPGTNISYQRKPDGTGDWSSGEPTFGQNNETKSSCVNAETTITPVPSPTSHEKISVSEAYVYPASGEGEWVELYNDNDFEVNLQNWFIDDGLGSGSSPKQFSLTIGAKRYAVYELSSSMFNNDGDTVRLLDTNSNVKHEFSYDESKEGFTVSPSCMRTPTKGSANNSCIEPTSGPVTSAPTKSPTPAKKPTPKASVAASSKASVKKVPPKTSQKAPPQRQDHDNAEVLGEDTAPPPNKKNALVKSLSFASLSYGFLAIGSILYKIKK